MQKQGLLQNTIIIITGDHGEEFFDNKNGYMGHSSNYTRFQTQTPFILYNPQQKPEIYQYTTTHYDVAPTLLNTLLGCQNPFSQYSIGLGLYDHSTPRPFTIICSYSDFGVVEPTRITRVYSLGDYEIQDLHANPLPNAKLNLTIMSQAISDLRRFYQK